MMTVPLYQAHQGPSSISGTGHKGLWFERFFNKYTSTDWKIPKEGKTDWINTVTGPCGNSSQLKLSCQSLRLLNRSLNGRIMEMKTSWHLATGLGNPHPVENGFIWHPTLGVPYLTGAAVKGLLRAWVENWMDFEDSDNGNSEHNRLDTLYRWFGSEDKDAKIRTELRKNGFNPPSQCNALDTEAGMFIFFDAIPIAAVTLHCDIMTPHYGNWYEQDDTIQNKAKGPDKIPADWHNPVPIPFLVLKTDLVKRKEVMSSKSPPARNPSTKLDNHHKNINWTVDALTI